MASLVEGSVLVSKGTTENILKPGQQARITGNNFSIAEIDRDEVTAWKNNQFKFANMPIDAIMRQAERWYDAETVYLDKVNYHFNATIERSVPISKLLHLLEETGQVHFKIDGRKVIVMK
jgi:D-alanine-D-alanine ligase-like ATP-grasp enzyme